MFLNPIKGGNINPIQQAYQLIGENKLAEAEKFLIGFLQTNPEHPQALYAMAQVGIRVGAFEQVLPLLKKCVGQLPQDPNPLLQLAQVSAEVSQTDSSDQYYRALIKQFPEWAEGYFHYGGFLQAIGQLDHAKQMLQKAIKLEPKHCGAYLALTGLQKMDFVPEMVQSMEDLLTGLESEASLSDNAANLDYQKMQLNYALGKSKADQNKSTEAFKYWQKANDIQLTQCGFKVEQMKPFFNSLKNQFMQLGQLKPMEELDVEAKFKDQLTPVFIVGLPRSGSTLLEQILTSHTDVESVGEVNYIANLLVNQIQSITQQVYPEGLEKISSEQFQLLGKNYLEQLQKHHPQAKFIIDKLPANFQSIGLIKRAMPHAVIIHLKREPMAVAFSIFRNFFAANEPYFCSLEELADYYLIYQDLMTFWREEDGQTWLDMDYEKLVESSQSEITRILEACGLQWQDECLTFYKNKQRVVTLSDNQVRQPVHQKANDEWHNYVEYLKPFAVRIGL